MRKRFEVPVERLESGVLVLKRHQHDDDDVFDPWAARRFENRVLNELSLTLGLMFAVPVLMIVALILILR